MRIAPPIARGLRLSIVEGSLWAVYWNIIAGVVINALALAIGARPLHIAILNALPLLGQVFGLPAARYLQTRDHRKAVALFAEALSRGVWLLVPLLVYLAPGDTRVWFVLGIAALSHMAHASGAVAWLSWMSDLVPEAIRGTYFGVRTAILGVVGAAGVMLASVWADGVRADEPEPGAYLRVLLALVVIAVVVGALGWWGLSIQPVRRMRRLAEAGWGTIARQLRRGNGRRIAVCWAALAFSAGVTMGIFPTFFLDRLGMSMVGFTAYGWIALAVSTAATPWLGRLADRWGHRTMLIVAWVGVFAQPLLSFFTPNDLPHLAGLMPWTIALDALVGGCFWPVVGIAQTNLVIGEAASESRAGLFASLSAIAGIAGFVGAMLGGGMAEYIGDGSLGTVAGVAVDDLRGPMLLGFALRLLAGFTILAVREPPREGPGVTSAQAFTVVWRLVVGKPIRPPAR